MILDIVNPFILIYFPKYIIDALTLKKDFANVLAYILIMILSLLIISFITNSISCKVNLLNKKTDLLLLREVGKKSMNIDYVNVERSDGMDKIRNARYAVEINVLQKVLMAIQNIISSIFILIGLIVTLYSLNYFIIIILLIIVTINSLANVMSKRADYDFSQSTKTNSRKNNYLYGLMMDFKIGKEVRLFSMNEFILKKYKECREEFYTMRKKLAFPYIGVSAAASITGLIQRLFIYIYMSYQFVKDLITIGDFSLYISSAEQFTLNLTNIISNIKDIHILNKHLNNLILFINIDDGFCKGMIYTKLINEICFNNVCFKYPGQTEYALKNVSFTIKEGEKIAIVGENGAGKTTMIKLLMRLYIPESGNITINHHDINNYDFFEYTKYFSTVFQDFNVFSFTVRDNINPCLSDCSIDKINTALDELDLKEKIYSLVNNIDTFMFRNYDSNGIELSLGEQQKLVMARAIYKDSPIFIMDEPTSALSPFAEEQIYLHMSEMSSNKTTIFISHRLASTKFCDRIFVFKHGELIESGSQKELINQQGEYYKLFELQAALYRGDER